MAPRASTDPPLRIGLVGCGQIAQAHAVALRFLEEDGVARLHSAADPDPSGIERVAAIAGNVERTSREASAVIGDPDVDAVAVVAPTRFHRDLIAEVAAAGKPLFTEKPLAPSFATVCEIAELVRAAGIPTQVGFQSRFHPIVRQLQRWVVDGDLGAPMAYTIRDDQFWPTGSVVPGHTSWRAERAQAGGGALLEHSIHSCDLACWLFGPVTRVSATTRHVFGFDVEDVAALTIEHQHGVVGTLLTVFNGVRDREERRIEVFLERAAVEATTDFVVGAREDSLLLKQDGSPAEHVDVAALRRAAFAADGFDPDRQVFVYQYFSYAAFAESVRQGTDPVPGVADAVRAHEVVEAAYRSARADRPVSVDELR